jgi:hypothetical protein
VVPTLRLACSYPATNGAAAGMVDHVVASAWAMSSWVFLIAWLIYSVRMAWTGADVAASWVDRLIRIKTGRWSWQDTGCSQI